MFPDGKGSLFSWARSRRPAVFELDPRRAAAAAPAEGGRVPPGPPHQAQPVEEQAQGEGHGRGGGHFEVFGKRIK